VEAPDGFVFRERVARPTLDDVFLELTGHAAEADGESTESEVEGAGRR
jgi:hypothetical protein